MFNPRPFSPVHIVPSDVSQGSFLDPLLFILFTSDLLSVPISSKLLMYADDIILVTPFVPVDSSAERSNS